jgi:CO/xanthine dehydrogenase Mo-binding subunit
MRVKVARGIQGRQIDKALPKRYAGLADETARRAAKLDVLLFSDARVVTSADAARALKRLGDVGKTALAFVHEATVEALAAFQAAGVRVFAVHSFGWTDERYRKVRQPNPHARDRGPGGFPR